MIYMHAYQPFLNPKGEFHDLKGGHWGFKGEIFRAMTSLVLVCLPRDHE